MPCNQDSFDWHGGSGNQGPHHHHYQHHYQQQHLQSQGSAAIAVVAADPSLCGACQQCKPAEM